MPDGAGVLTGPGEEGKTFATPGAACSAGITRAARALEPCTFYVRSPDGTPRYRVERHEGRCNITVTATDRA